MYKDDRIDVSVHLKHADHVRQMEIYSGQDGAKNPWTSIIVQVIFILALIAGAVFSLLNGSGGSFIPLGILALFYAPVVIIRAVNVPRQRKVRQAQYEEAKKADYAADENGVFSFSFGRYNLFARNAALDEPIPYRSFSRCVEYSDGLYFERELDDGLVSIIFIPARYLSTETSSQITSRVRAEYRRYTCVSQLRPADPPQSETASGDLFDLNDHKLLCEAEYTLTPEEIKTATSRKFCFMAARNRLKAMVLIFAFMTLFFVGIPALMFAVDGASFEAYMMTVVSVVGIVLLIWALYYSNIFSVAKMQRKLLGDEAKYGSRVALYEDMACVRVYGDDSLHLYNWLPGVFRTKEFVCVRNSLIPNSGRVPMGYFAIPVRALEDADEFVRILEDRIQAAADGAIVLMTDRSAFTGDLTDSQPLRKEIRKGKKILTARYKGMDVCVRRRFRVTELIIDGCVYAEQKELIESAYELNAVVNGVVFDAQQRENGVVQIFAQGLEIASGMHKI